jgi:cytoskeletal protein CcmA (bactofilin family)
MADINPTGSLLVGEGVYMKGSMRVPGTASIDGKMEGELSAETVIIQPNGSMDGQTTADHIRVAGSLTNTTVANRTLIIESTGVIAGAITYEELEIKKGGSLQGGIYKVGQAAGAKPVRQEKAEPVAEAVAAPDVEPDADAAPADPSASEPPAV